MAKPALIIYQGDPSTWANPNVGWTAIGINFSGQLVSKQSDGTITVFGSGGGGGTNGWSPLMAIVADGERRVMQITGWTGGTGTPPASPVYVGPTGFVALIANATDIRGAAGGGGGSGTVTSVTGATANGFVVSTTNPTTTPVVTVGTSITGIAYGTGTAIRAAVAADFPVLNQSTTGNAATATALQTARNINGQSFNGTADITVAAAAGTLTGSSLAANVTTASGLTTVAGGTFGSAAFVAASTFEPALGNPAADGYVLASTTGGVRSWVPNGGGGGGSGTVTTVSVATANGMAGSVANASTTPAITLTTTVTGIVKGNGTAFSAATAGTDYSAGTSALGTGIVKTTTGTGALSIAGAGDFPTLNQNTTGSAATLTTARNINGVAFNGSANITIGVAAADITGTSLPVGITTASGLTTVAGGVLGTAAFATLSTLAPLASPALTGTPTAPTATAGTSTTQLATTAFVTTADNLKAPLASPALTGVPTAPTAANGTNTTQLATTAFVLANAGGGGGGTKTAGVFTPLDNQPPASNYATFSTTNSIALLQFDDTTAQSAVFMYNIPEGLSVASGLQVYLNWVGMTATSGVARWGAQFEKVNTIISSDSFDTAVEANSATSVDAALTPNFLTITPITTIDKLTDGDTYRVRVYRAAADVDDTMVGFAGLISAEVRAV